MEKQKNIGIVVLATNAYFLLGLRLVRRFMHFYKGNEQITFYFFSDKNPFDYLPDSGFNLVYYFTENPDWVSGTNLKFKSILRIEQKPDYLFYFDADTNIDKDFDESWFLGYSVAGQHYADQAWMKERKAFDRNPQSKAYIPEDTDLPQMYFYGAFFGGSYEFMINFCNVMCFWQAEDKKIPYEPGVNDESYINAYFHYNPPTKTVYCPEFKFLISDKGGLGETRRMDLDLSKHLQDVLLVKQNLWDIRNNQIVTV